jgi:hypothetical protein
MRDVDSISLPCSSRMVWWGRQITGGSNLGRRFSVMAASASLRVRMPVGVPCSTTKQSLKIASPRIAKGLPTCSRTKGVVVGLNCGFEPCRLAWKGD